MTRTPEEALAVGAYLLAKASKARIDICEFFNFVMRDFTRHTRVSLAPHQKVVLEFVRSHDACVIMLPVGHSKTWLMSGITLFLMGQDNTLRGGIVSASAAQAEKILSVARSYIEESPELRLVFPKLKRSRADTSQWTQHALTIDRPPGIKDPSLSAYGIDSEKITGSRLNWIIIDDVLNQENTNTKEQRDKVFTWIQSSVLSRLDPKKGRIVVTNTPWHPDDAVHRLWKSAGWATLKMDSYGAIEVYDGRENIRNGIYWDSTLIRSSTDSPHDQTCRLVDHDPDFNNEIPLWPEMFPLEELEKRRREMIPKVFNQVYRCVCRDDDSSLFKVEFIDKCKELARDAGCYSMTAEYVGMNPTFTGIDLAIGLGEQHDETAFFTFELLDDGRRKILDIEIGRWDGPTVCQKAIKKHKDYKSTLVVENNSGQAFMYQFILEKDPSVSIKPFTTGRNKAHPEYGVATLSVEMANGAWFIPNTVYGEVHPMVQRFIDACLYYSPTAHTPDVLMASFFAREQCRQWFGSIGSAKKNDQADYGAITER